MLNFITRLISRRGRIRISIGSLISVFQAQRVPATQVYNTTRQVFETTARGAVTGYRQAEQLLLHARRRFLLTTVGVATTTGLGILLNLAFNDALNVEVVSPRTDGPRLPRQTSGVRDLPIVAYDGLRNNESYRDLVFFIRNIYTSADEFLVRQNIPPLFFPGDFRPSTDSNIDEGSTTPNNNLDGDESSGASNESSGNPSLPQDSFPYPSIVERLANDQVAQSRLRRITNHLVRIIAGLVTIVDDIIVYQPTDLEEWQRQIDYRNTGPHSPNSRIYDSTRDQRMWPDDEALESAPLAPARARQLVADTLVTDTPVVATPSENTLLTVSGKNVNLNTPSCDSENTSFRSPDLAGSGTRTGIVQELEESVEESAKSEEGKVSESKTGAVQKPAKK